MELLHPSSSSQNQQMQQPGTVLFQEGCISITFGRKSAERYFQSVLKTELRFWTPYMSFSATGYPDSFSIQQEMLPTLQPNTQSADGRPLLIIDYKADLARGTIVRQALWTPYNRTDQCQYVERASLSLPIFFVHKNGAVGLTVADAAAGRCEDLRDAGLPADMRDKASTHIRINWPGYVGFKRQFQTKDGTKERNPITVERLVRHVGRSIDYFLQHCEEDTLRPNQCWRIGHDGITRDNITVLGVCHVSSGSWMPILQVFPTVVDLQILLADIIETE